MPLKNLSECTKRPPAFILVGDSTTAVQSSDGGGWGNGFLSFLRNPAWGINLGQNGATTLTFREGGRWEQVKELVERNAKDFNVFVTIQFGHNDQKPAVNITIDDYRDSLKIFVEDVKSLGGTPLLLTPLTRRDFVSEENAIDSLHDQRLATILAAMDTSATFVDLNKQSLWYVNAIGCRIGYSDNAVTSSAPVPTYLRDDRKGNPFFKRGSSPKIT